MAVKRDGINSVAEVSLDQQSKMGHLANQRIVEGRYKKFEKKFLTKSQDDQLIELARNNTDPNHSEFLKRHPDMAAKIRMTLGASATKNRGGRVLSESDYKKLFDLSPSQKSVARIAIRKTKKLSDRRSNKIMAEIKRVSMHIFLQYMKISKARMKLEARISYDKKVDVFKGGPEGFLDTASLYKAVNWKQVKISDSDLRKWSGASGGNKSKETELMKSLKALDDSLKYVSDAHASVGVLATINRQKRFEIAERALDHFINAMGIASKKGGQADQSPCTNEILSMIYNQYLYAYKDILEVETANIRGASEKSLMNTRTIADKEIEVVKRLLSIEYVNNMSAKLFDGARMRVIKTVEMRKASEYIRKNQPTTLVNNLSAHHITMSWFIILRQIMSIPIVAEFGFDMLARISNESTEIRLRKAMVIMANYEIGLDLAMIQGKREAAKKMINKIYLYCKENIGLLVAQNEYTEAYERDPFFKLGRTILSYKRFRSKVDPDLQVMIEYFEPQIMKLVNSAERQRGKASETIWKSAHNMMNGIINLKVDKK